jgi:hypothetical protein
MALAHYIAAPWGKATKVLLFLSGIANCGGYLWSGKKVKLIRD